MNISEFESSIAAEFIARYKEAAQKKGKEYDLYTWLDNWFGLPQYTGSESQIITNGAFIRESELRKNVLSNILKSHLSMKNL